MLPRRGVSFHAYSHVAGLNVIDLRAKPPPGWTSATNRGQT
jgi:hypothetical protein